MGSSQRLPHPAHTGGAYQWLATSQSDGEVRKAAKTHIHTKYDEVAVELHQDTVGQLYQAKRGVWECEGDAVTGCLWQGSKATGIWHWKLCFTYNRRGILIKNERAGSNCHPQIHPLEKFVENCTTAWRTSESICSESHVHSWHVQHGGRVPQPDLQAESIIQKSRGNAGYNPLTTWQWYSCPGFEQKHIRGTHDPWQVSWLHRSWGSRDKWSLGPGVRF